MHLNMSSGKWRPFCLFVNVLMGHATVVAITKATILVPYHKVELVQLIWKFGTLPTNQLHWLDKHDRMYQNNSPSDCKNSTRLICLVTPTMHTSWTHQSCISCLVCVEPPVCYLSPSEYDVMLHIHHCCACSSFSGGLHASGQIWP